MNAHDPEFLDVEDIVSNHPFVDGNKRTGTLAAVVFLDVNGISIDHPPRRSTS